MAHFLLNTDLPPASIMEMIFRLKVKDVMTADIYVVQKSHKMARVRQVMKGRGVTGLPVVENFKNMRLMGIVSISDLLDAMGAGDIEKPVENYMTKNVVALEEDMPLSFAINYIDKYNFGRFPVLNKMRRLVGIVTNRDIVNHLLGEMNREMVQLEKMLPPENTWNDSENIQLDFVCHRYDFENAGKASAKIKQVLKKRGVSRPIIRRVAIASYELEINLVIHSLGGQLQFFVRPHEVEIVASDEGPGIACINSALTEGYSTAGDWIRSLGFGAGMGLPNVQRVSDDFAFESRCEEGKAGTVVRVKISTLEDANGGAG